MKDCGKLRKTTTINSWYWHRGKPIPVADMLAWGEEARKKQPRLEGVFTFRAACNKQAARDELLKLAANDGLDGKRFVIWVHGEYKFCFVKNIYVRQNCILHITYHEALYLYKRYILGDAAHNTQRYYLRNMRRRFGKDFLLGVNDASFVREVYGGDIHLTDEAVVAYMTGRKGKCGYGKGGSK